MGFLLRSIAAVAALASVSPAAVLATAAPPLAAAQKAQAWETYGKIPLSFEANEGQADRRVQFLSRGAGFGLFLTSGEAVVETQDATLHMQLLGGNAAAVASPIDPLPGSVNYIQGNNPARWKTDVHSYQRVQYSGVYPGVDLVYYGNQRQLEYDFILAPGADAGQIGLRFTGATLKIDHQGDLVLASSRGEARFHKPIVYQMADGVRVDVPGAYHVSGQRVTFVLGPYDHSRSLIIDPVLSYMTYLGGSDSDYIGNASSQGTGGHQSNGIAVDGSGSVYVTGSTLSTNFPVKNAYQSTGTQQSGHQTAFVTKLNATGTAFVYSTYLGGTVIDEGFAIAVDAAGSAYVVGGTFSPDFPVTTGAFQTLCSPELSNNAIKSACGFEGSANSFLTKLSADGKSLVYSTFIGGDDRQGADTAYGVALDAKNQAYVVGISGDTCDSTDPIYYCFPTTADAFVQGSENSDGPNAPNEVDGFLSVFSADGSSLLYSTLVTHPVAYGSQVESFAVALDSAGNIYTTGTTTSGNLSTTAGAFQTSSGPVLSTQGTAVGIYQRAWVEKFSPVAASGGPKITYLTYLGGTTTSGTNFPTGITADAAGNAYVFGKNNDETDLPTTAGAYQTSCASNTAYLAKLNPTGSALVWATCFGGAADNGGATNGSVSITSNIALDAAGDVFVALTGDSTLPTVNPITTTAGGSQAFVTEFDPTGAKLLFSTPVGGPMGGEFAAGLVLDANGAIYLAGQVYSTDLPVTAGAAQATYGGGGYDSFMTKIAVPVKTTTALALSAATVTAGQSVTFTATVTGATGGPIPTGTVTFKNGTTTLGTQTLNATAMATFTTSSLAVGTYSITAAYGGDAGDQTSTSGAAALSITAALINTTTALTASSATATAGSAVTLTATVTPASGTVVPTGSVNFMEGGTVLGMGTLDGTGKTSLVTSTLAVGANAVSAVYSGDKGDNASTSAAVTVTITAAPVATTTTLTATPTTAVSGTAIIFTAHVAPASGAVATGTVTFTEGTATLGTGTLDATGAATFSITSLAVGSDSVTASYGGNAADSASVSAAVIVTVTAQPMPDFAVSLTPTTGTVTAGSSATTAVAITPANGFAAATELTCSGLPSNSTCSFAPASVTPSGAAATSTLTIATNVTAATANSVSGTRPPMMLAGMLASFLLLPLIGRRNRQIRQMLMVGVVLVAATVTMGGMSGCHGGHGGSTSVTPVTPSGTYTVSVTVTSGTLTHSATYTLIVQ
jgi:hypothetical protein